MRRDGASQTRIRAWGGRILRECCPNRAERGQPGPRESRMHEDGRNFHEISPARTQRSALRVFGQHALKIRPLRPRNRPARSAAMAGQKTKEGWPSRHARRFVAGPRRRFSSRPDPADGRRRGGARAPGGLERERVCDRSISTRTDAEDPENRHDPDTRPRGRAGHNPGVVRDSPTLGSPFG
jgi:hypothetical protein